MPTVVKLIRDATLDERVELEALQRRASLAWDDYREQLTAHPDAIELGSADIEEHRTRVACGSGRRIGFSVVLAPRGATCELDGLFVEPDLWRSGAGRALIDDVADNAVKVGVTSLQVTANPRALDFYLAVGFQRGVAVPTRFGPGLRMELTLHPNTPRA